MYIDLQLLAFESAFEHIAEWGLPIVELHGIDIRGQPGAARGDTLWVAAAEHRGSVDPGTGTACDPMFAIAVACSDDGRLCVEFEGECLDALLVGLEDVAVPRHGSRQL